VPADCVVLCRWAYAIARGREVLHVRLFELDDVRVEHGVERIWVHH
jgi:hypothetical protein